MTNQEENYTKQPKYIDRIERYPLGGENWINTIPTSRGLRCWGDIEGKHYQIECKDIDEFQKIIPELITQSKINHIAQSVREEEIALRIKENGLEKTSKDLGGKK